MSIQLLDQGTINKIAAGEVIERPMAVVKELVENAIDAGANAITIEVKEGGIQFIRVTDNGKGIAKKEIPLAFERHSTSKIKNIEDLLTVQSLGFRGEALSSIAAVSQVELITKSSSELIGAKYIIEGGREYSLDEIGCPEGTTLIIRNLFFNTPARRKFLKSPATEAGYIHDIVERFAVSHPRISIKFLCNGQQKVHTSGNGNLKDVIYQIYGRDIASNLLEVHGRQNGIFISGFIAKPEISRGNRNYMNYYINGRYIKSSILHRAIEEAYKGYRMSHRYPFTVLLFEVDTKYLDVNVHPTKMEVRFTNQEDIHRMTFHTLVNALKKTELIPNISLVNEQKRPAIKSNKAPEPFEKNRLQGYQARKDEQPIADTEVGRLKQVIYNAANEYKQELKDSVIKEPKNIYNSQIEIPIQQNLLEGKFISAEAEKEWIMIGQLFSTYWIFEYQDNLFILDQHAAHEKVMYEKLMTSIEKKDFLSQMIQPPIILTLTMREEEALKINQKFLKKLGFEIEHFGGKEYAVSSVPSDIPDIAKQELLIELIDKLVEDNGSRTPDLLMEKIASLSCKAAVKGKHKLSTQEVNTLMEQLMNLKNPYHCPHGRPTIIRISKAEIEKKFKRIV